MANYFFKEERAPSDKRPVIVAVDAAYIPVVISAIEGRKARSFWASDDDFRRGSDALTAFQEALLMDIGAELIAAVDRVYMAVRQLSVGEVFSAAPGGIPPTLPVVPPSLPAEVATGALGQLYESRGTVPGGWFGIGARPATMADVLSALRAGQEDELTTLLDKVDLLGDASDITSIYNAVKGSAVDLASLAEGGGTLATLVVATMAQVATAGLAAQQMTELIASVQRLIEQVGVPAAPAPEETVAGELAAIRDNLTP